MAVEGDIILSSQMRAISASVSDAKDNGADNSSKTETRPAHANLDIAERFNTDLLSD
jgi:hypothetical protein